MQSIYWDTNGTGDGSAGGYTEAQLFRWLRATFNRNDPANEYVLAGVGSEFAVSGAASPLSVGSGFAYVNGVPAWDDNATNVTVPTPVLGATGHRIVLQANPTAQTVRIVLKSSAEGVSSAPLLTQNATGIYEVSLARVTANTNGSLQVVDERKFAHFAGRVGTPGLDDASVTTAKLADGAVTPGKLAPSAVLTNLGYTPVNKAGDTMTGSLRLHKNPALSNSAFADAQIELRADTGLAAIGFHKVNADALTLYYNGGIDLRLRDDTGPDGKLWSELNDGDGSGLDADKLKGRTIYPLARAGGSPLNWNTAGGGGHSPPSWQIQVGAAAVPTNGAAASQIIIGFPDVFQAIPLVQLTPTLTDSSVSVLVNIQSVSVSSVTVHWRLYSGTGANFTIHWMAIGPR